MEYIKKHPAPLLALIGAAAAAQSYFWELARVQPNYRFIVEPWSVRGADTVQGKVISIIAIAVIVLIIVAWRDVAVESSSVPAWAVGVAFLAVAIAIAALAGGDREITFSTSQALAGSLGAGIILNRIIMTYLGPTVPQRYRKLVSLGLFVGITLIAYFALAVPLLVNETKTVALWLLAIAIIAPLLAVTLLVEPRELATNRIVILGVLAGWAMVTFSAGAVRSRLLELQTRDAGVGAQYKDLQITSGMILAFIGMLLAFLGVVAMWAQRRDQLLAMKRATQQREAAEASAAELDAALAAIGDGSAAYS